MQPVVSGRYLGALPLGMGDTAARHHKVDISGPDGLAATHRVPMQYLTLEQIGYRGEADVRMRQHVDALARREVRRSHFIKKDPGPDHFSLCGWQQTADRKTSQIGYPGAQDRLNSAARRIG